MVYSTLPRHFSPFYSFYQWWVGRGGGGGVGGPRAGREGWKGTLLWAWSHLLFFFFYCTAEAQHMLGDLFPLPFVLFFTSFLCFETQNLDFNGNMLPKGYSCHGIFPWVIWPTVAHSNLGWAQKQKWACPVLGPEAWRGEAWRGEAW